ncbi:tyrosine--tRNA ligase [Intestinibacter bartlettii]|uniref:tyrosine--tRNA ligase n=1 Tax=Intestinibacter bartlettii TaxID=261299 RepID=UPI001D0F4E32|nr:tyrosine--tRNA ligase [Intestinibacter bartlettii]MCC2706589.1 tyrosine--tRNA ligase [Intestinibacter bartlettii]MCC2762038.1 tyrosine--tRNA ligase [Intestinibacter bartlettii]MDU6473198.1 tyrosine--tRNA ligase [Intestinibacter bartlettii]
MKSLEEQLKIIKKGTLDIINEEELIKKLEKSIKENKPLKIKLGLDPSAPDIHLGHTVVLRKLKQLQDLGHEIIIIIGDFTGKIGDPTGKSRMRKFLSDEEVLQNAKTYEEQVFKILDKEKTSIKFNSEWLSKLTFGDVLKLTASTTVARMLEREDFKLRFENQRPIYLNEFFYPLMQAFDSTAIEADIEFGGTDQRFNLLSGRNLQKEIGEEPQIVIMMPLIEGLDGKNKMSKTLGNYIGIYESAKSKYQKVMEIPDELIVKYYTLLTDVDDEKIKEVEAKLKDESVNPRDIKMDLAREIVSLYHTEEEVEQAEERFKMIFQMGQKPKDIDTVNVSKEDFDLISTVVDKGLVSSKSEFRRLLLQGGIKINDKKITMEKDLPKEGEIVVQVGKKKFMKIIVS